MELPLINYESLETRSTKTTTTTTNDHYLYYSDTKYLELDMRNISQRIPFRLFQHINSLVIYMPTICSSSSNNLLNIMNSVQSNENDDCRLCVNYLSHIVHLFNVNEINFQSEVNTSGWKDIQLILQACQNVINLNISPSYLLLSEFIDNQYLIIIFKQIKMLNSTTEDCYIPGNFTSKIVERFPSLTDIKLRVYSFNELVSAVDILLYHLKNLSYLKIYCSLIPVFDDYYCPSYIIEKRRQAFNLNIIDEYKVVVKRSAGYVEIRLS